jgi:hypothetical protein
MATNIIPEISKRSSFYISKHRHYELKHFCLQYPEWKKELLELRSSYEPKSQWGGTVRYSNKVSDKTGDLATRIVYLENCIQLIESVASEVDPVLGWYILKAVTEDLSYVTLDTKFYIPCGKDLYYKLYRQFFWILSKRRE